MWIVILYDECGDVTDDCFGPFGGPASADEFGANYVANSRYNGYLVLEVCNPPVKMTPQA